MPVTADLTLEQTRLLIHQSTVVTAEIRNTDKEPLLDLNALNYGGGPDYVLTDLQRGESEIYHNLRVAGSDPTPVNLAGNRSLKDEFFLTDRFVFPRPGRFTLQARYSWDGGSGQTASPAVPVEVLPATPRSLNVSSARGAAGPISFAGWVNQPEPAGSRLEIWMSEICTSRKPRIRDSHLIAQTPSVVEAFISVPPGTPPACQWVAWVEGARLGYVLFVNGKASEVSHHKLPDEGYRIIPPIFQNPPKRGETIPGVDVLLHRPGTSTPEGRLLVAHLGASGREVPDDAVGLPAGNVPWAASAYLTGGQRVTLLALAQQDQTALWAAAWSANQPPPAPQQVHAWRGHFVAGALSWTIENEIHGILLLDRGSPGDRKYCFETWTADEKGACRPGASIPLKFPAGQDIIAAICRGDDVGQPYALLRVNDKDRTWRWCEPNGEVGFLSGAAERFKLPGEILFRHGSDPVVMFSEPNLGFRLVRPRS